MIIYYCMMCDVKGDLNLFITLSCTIGVQKNNWINSNIVIGLFCEQTASCGFHLFSRKGKNSLLVNEKVANCDNGGNNSCL